MPTYEYACKSCGRHTDVVQSFSDDALTICPHCGGPLRKVFGNIGIAFKGNGFYKNDSRVSTNGKADTKADREPSTANGSGDKSDKSEKGEAAKGDKKAAESTGPGDTKSATAKTPTTPSKSTTGS